MCLSWKDRDGKNSLVFFVFFSVVVLEVVGNSVE